MKDRYDVIVIGGGAGGLAAARSSLRNGSVALIEADRPGGDCTFTGCVPSKTMIEVASRVSGVRGLDDVGVTATTEVDLLKVLAHVRRIVEEISGDESPDVLRDEGIDLIEGRAVLDGPTTVVVEGRSLRADNIVLAVGSRPSVPTIPGLDAVGFETNETIFSLSETPRHLAVLGGGAIGCELAQAFGRLGLQVTVLEAADRLVPVEEPEASATLSAVFEREGIAVHTGARVASVAAGRSGPVVEIEGGERIEASHLLVATGRTPSTAGMGLTEAGVSLAADGSIEIDDRSRTSVKHIYAVGDCATNFRFTHVADEQGRTAARDIGSRMPHRFDRSIVPWVTYTDPEIGRVGMTEAQAYERFGEDARVAVMPMARTDRGRMAGRPDGLVKMIAAPRKILRSLAGGQLVGMTAVCPAGGEIISEGTLAMKTKALAGRIAQTIHPYPAWSIATRQAAAQWFLKMDRPARPGAD